jgi:CheY-like chemotaxis protein
MTDHKQVLLIEDDEEIVAGASVRLRASGYDVISARDGEEGIAAAARSLPDAIILDIHMPRMDGLTALNCLKTRMDTCHIPVVMLSASLSEQTPALDAGAQCYLRKPYQAKTLLAALSAAVELGSNASEHRLSGAPTP